MDIWSYETNRRTWERITFDPGDDIYALWSPDGGSMVFGAVRGTQGIVDLYRKLLSGGSHGKEELLLSTPNAKFPMDWSVTLAYRQQYLVSADGQSFVMNSAVTEGTASPITVILNWKP